mmetsp:Transcript_14362/g.36686  ORF Transcript_14362/g.36686 Transcript_14362/m.36686 type:complete len:386 (+) Transcript_14362:344-1501(+)
MDLVALARRPAHDEVADRVQVLAERAGDLPFDGRHRQEPVRRHLRGVAQPRDRSVPRRRRRRGLQAPEALVVPEVALGARDILHGDLADGALAPRGHLLRRLREDPADERVRVAAPDQRAAGALQPALGHARGVQRDAQGGAGLEGERGAGAGHPEVRRADLPHAGAAVFREVLQDVAHLQVGDRDRKVRVVRHDLPDLLQARRDVHRRVDPPGVARDPLDQHGLLAGVLRVAHLAHGRGGPRPLRHLLAGVVCRTHGPLPFRQLLVQGLDSLGLLRSLLVQLHVLEPIVHHKLRRGGPAELLLAIGRAGRLLDLLPPVRSRGSRRQPLRLVLDRFRPASQRPLGERGTLPSADAPPQRRAAAASPAEEEPCRGERAAPERSRRR